MGGKRILGKREEKINEGRKVRQRKANKKDKKRLFFNNNKIKTQQRKIGKNKSYKRERRRKQSKKRETSPLEQSRWHKEASAPAPAAAPEGGQSQRKSI